MLLVEALAKGYSGVVLLSQAWIGGRQRVVLVFEALASEHQEIALLPRHLWRDTRAVFFYSSKEARNSRS